MHSISFKFIALIMATWLLVTSIGASIDVHFCNGKIFSLGINAQADKCPGYSADEAALMDEAFTRPPCCDQFSAYFQSDVDGQGDDLAIDFSDYTFIKPWSQEVDLLSIAGPIQLCEYYNPPDHEEDILTLYSVFRI